MTREQITSTEKERARALLDCPEAYALFLDIDGTLLEMAPAPDAVHVPPALPAILEELVFGLNGAVALLTGRRIASADRLLHPLRLIACGVHGTELRSELGGQIAMLAPPIPPALAAAVTALGGLADGVLIERKGAGIAVHYRHAPQLRDRLATELRGIVASCAGLVLREGRMVLEIGPGGFSKGSALALLHAQAPFAGRRPVMIGDDSGDETALHEAEARGGVALRVAGEHFSAAAADFAGVEAVRGFLGAFAAAMRTRTMTQGSPRGIAAVGERP
jgi:trehalose 6-phosphate phosphatase